MRLAERILKGNRLKREPIRLPEWAEFLQEGEQFFVRELTGRERDQHESDLVKVDASGNREVNVANIRARVAGMCLILESGERVFSDQEIEALGGESGAALDRIYDAALRLSGMRVEDEAAEKKGPATPPGDSSSA